jgi:TonB-linked SusC/RagA family outer membrane protein
MKKNHFLQRTTFRKAGSEKPFRIFLFIMLLLILVTNRVFSSNTDEQQKIKITGIVSDINGNPLAGVTVVAKGTTSGSLSGPNGEFQLEIPDNAKILQFSFVGMKTLEIAIEDKTYFTVVMEEESIGLEEVAIIGYGSVKKSDITGSVSSISSKDFGDRQRSDIGSLIQGKASGVDVSLGKIRIRGVTTFNNTDPLIVIDGFLGGNLETLNPNDISRIEILKDASATAIFGSRGANGVILVTTKGGKAGPLQLNVRAYIGSAVTPKRLDVMNASQYVDYMGDVLGNAGQSLSEKLMSPEVREDVTFWQDELFRTAHNSEFNVDFSGGSDKATYFMGIGYKSLESIAIGPEESTLYIRTKNDFNIAKWFRAGNNFAFNYTTNKGRESWLRGAIGMPPYYGVYDPTNLGGYSNVNRSEDLTETPNPVPVSTLTHPVTTIMGYQTNLWSEITPVKGLVYRMQAGVNGYFGHDKTWQDEYINEGVQHNYNGISEGSNYSFMPLLENTLTYSQVFGRHNFSAMLGNTWQDYAYGGGISISAEQFDNTEVQNVFLGKSKSIDSQTAWNYAYLSYFGRLHYQFNDKYLMTVNMRRDGSPRFAPQNRWGTFPSVAVAWNMHKEEFIKNLNLFDQLKIRTSWGVSGNDAIGDFRYTSQVWTNGVYYPLGGVPVPGATIKDNASNDIKWESTESKNIGTDMSFFKNALTVTADYFIKNTNDILFSVPRPASLGYGLNYGGDAIVNAASVENKGFELMVGFRGEVKSINFSVNANYTNFKNEVIGLGLGQPYLSGISRTDIGNPIGYFYGFVADGVFMKQTQLDAANTAAQAKGFDFFQEAATSAGDVRFKDLNGDGHITWDGDRKMIGNSIPKHMFGLNITLDYKGFDFICYFQGIAGSDIYYGTYDYTRAGITARNQEAYVLDRWRSETEPGNGIVPRAINGDPSVNVRPSTLMVSPGDYLKLRQLSLGYTVPSLITGKAGIENARFYVSAANLLSITKFDGYDPEVGGENLERGIDYLGYPNPRSIIFGIQLAF